MDRWDELRWSVRESDYLIEDWLEVTERWEVFRASHNPKELHEAARILCRSISDLKEDERFWEHAPLLVGEAEYRAGAMEALANVDHLLALEEQVLAEIVGWDKARKLVLDMALAVEMVRDSPSTRTIRNLHNRMGDLREVFLRCSILL